MWRRTFWTKVSWDFIFTVRSYDSRPYQERTCLCKVRLQGSGNCSFILFFFRFSEERFLHLNCETSEVRNKINKMFVELSKNTQDFVLQTKKKFPFAGPDTLLKYYKIENWVQLLLFNSRHFNLFFFYVLFQLPLADFVFLSLLIILIKTRQL